MVTVDPRTQALVWAAEKAAREVTVTLNLVPPPGIVAVTYPPMNWRACLYAKSREAYGRVTLLPD